MKNIKKIKSKFLSYKNLFLFLIIFGGFLFFSGEAMAANCGVGQTHEICECGDTVMTDYTLHADLDCSVSGGDGLSFGASNITIDGNGYTITGRSSHYGIYNDGFDYATTTNITIISFNKGIYYNSNANYGSITYSTSTFNMIGIYIFGSDSNTLIGNMANSNFLLGIAIYLSDTNTLTHNTVNFNSEYGIYLKYSSSNTLTNNTMSGNAQNLYVSVQFNNTIDTTNLVESKPVYYLYNEDGEAGAPVVYDGDVLGDIGMFWAIDCEYIEVKNAVLSDNNYYGIYFNNIASSTIENITVSNSNYGIYLDSSNTNTLINNTMSDNKYNLYVSVQFNNTIDTTNLVESKPVYYLYNEDGEAGAPVVYDGDVLGDIGMFWAIDCEYIEVKNAVLSDNNYYGIYFNNIASSTIENITVSNSNYGIYLDSSNTNTLIDNTANFNIYGVYFSSSGTNDLTDNTADSNKYGIYLKSSNTNTLTDNTANSNSEYGIYLKSSNTNTLTSNIISNNINDIYDNGANDYLLNQILHNTNNKMLTWTEINRVKNINDTVKFSFSMFDIQGQDLDKDPIITVYPDETIVTNRTDNNATSTFAFTQNGTYSLEIQTTDIYNNITKRKFVFLVGDDTDSETIRYYLRDVDPTHGQPSYPFSHRDAKSMLLTSPTEEEFWTCGIWIQNSPDELPPAYILWNLDSINIHSWYKFENDGYIGVQKFASYDEYVDQSQNISPSPIYILSDNNFSDLDWIMDYQRHWYWISLKLRGGTPYWRSIPSQPSYADFTYSYTTTPAIKSNSNEDIIILSATATSSISSISLENPTSTITTTNLVLTDFNSPFLNAASTITSDATTTIATGNISTSTPLTLNSVKMDVSIPSGSIDLTIDTWLMSGTQNKQWTATSTTATSTIYTIGDLKANTYYQFKLDNTASTTAITNDSVCTDGICKSDENGQIIFTYVGGYSTHTFGLEEGDNTAPVRSAGSPNSALSANTTETTLSLTTNETAICKYSTTANTDYSSMTAFSITGSETHSTNITGLTNNTNYNYYVKCQDTTGNINSSDYTISFSVKATAGGGIPIWMLNQTNQNQNQDSDDTTNNNQNQNIENNNNGKTIIEKIKQKVFSYSKSRLKSLSQEQNSAKTLKQELEKHYGENKIPVHKKHWHTIVNSYIYGNYPIQAIIQAIKFGGKTVHPTIPFSAWQKASDYLEWIGK